MEGTLYCTWKDSSGTVHSDEPIATFDSGKVYVSVDDFFGGIGKGQLIAEYINGRIYAVRKGTLERGELVAMYDEGKICSVSETLFGESAKNSVVGDVVAGTVYLLNGAVVARYDGDDEGAAAAAAVMTFNLSEDKIKPLPVPLGKLKGIIPKKRYDGSHEGMNTVLFILLCIAALIPLAMILTILIFLSPVILVGAVILAVLCIITAIRGKGEKGDAMKYSSIDYAVDAVGSERINSDMYPSENELDKTVKVRRRDSVETPVRSEGTYVSAERVPVSDVPAPAPATPNAVAANPTTPAVPYTPASAPVSPNVVVTNPTTPAAPYTPDPTPSNENVFGGGYNPTYGSASSGGKSIYDSNPITPSGASSAKSYSGMDSLPVMPSERPAARDNGIPITSDNGGGSRLRSTMKRTANSEASAGSHGAPSYPAPSGADRATGDDRENNSAPGMFQSAGDL